MVTKREKTMYKLLNHNNREWNEEETVCYRSPYQSYPYIIGKTYHVPKFSAFTLEQCDDMNLGSCPFDYNDGDHIMIRYGSIYNPDLRYVIFGIHGATTIDRLSTHIDGKPKLHRYCVAKFIIPKNTPYYLGVTNLITAQEAIFDSVVLEEVINYNITSDYQIFK